MSKLYLPRDLDRAEARARILAARLDGESLPSIARMLNEAGVPAPSHRATARWHASAVQRVLDEVGDVLAA